MGAAPSRETHRRGLFSLEQVSTTTTSTGNNSSSGKKQDIVLIPLTKEFFPSPDCPLFVQFHKARCDAAVNYYFRRPGNPGDLSRIPTYGGVRRTGHKVRQGKTHTQRRHSCQHYCDVCACDRKTEDDEEEVRKASDDQRCMSSDKQPSCSNSSDEKAKNMHCMKDGGDDNKTRRSSSCDLEGDDDKAEKNSVAAIDAALDGGKEEPDATAKEVNNEDGTTAIRAGTTNDATRHAVRCAKCGKVLDMDSNSSDSDEEEEEEEEDVSYPSREALYRGVIERVEEALFDTDAEMREAYAWSQHRSPSPYYNYNNSNGGYYGSPCQARKKVLPVLCAVAFRTDLSKLNNTNIAMNNVGATATTTATYGMSPNKNNGATISRGGGSSSTNGESMTEASTAQDGPFHTQTMLENGVYAFHSIINVVGCFGFVSMEEEVETPRWGNAHNNNNNEYANGGVDEREEDGGERPGLPGSTALHCPNTQTNTHTNDTSIPQASPTQDVVGVDEGNAQTKTATRLQVTHHPLTNNTNNTAASVTSYRHDPYSYSNSVATSCSGGSPTAGGGHSRVPSSISCASAPAPPLPQGAGGAQDLRSSLLSLTALGRGGPYDIMTLPPPVAAPLAAMVYLTKSAGEQNLGRITYIAACTYYYQLLQAGVICRYSGLAPATAVRAGTTNPNNNTNSAEGAGVGYLSSSGVGMAAQRFTGNNNTTTAPSRTAAPQQSLPAWQGFNSAFLPRECLPPMETFSFSSLLTNIPILCFLYEMKWRWGYLGILKNGTPTAQLNINSFSFASSSMGSAREASAAAAFGRHVRQKQRNTDGNYMASSLASSFSAASAYTSPSNVMPPYNNNNNYNNSYLSNGHEGSMGNTAMMMMMRGTTTTHSTGGLPGIDGSSGQSISDEMEMWITADSMIHGRISKDLAERLCWSLAERPEVMQERVTHLPSVEDGYWRYRGLVDRQHPPPLPNTALHNVNPISTMMMNGTEAAMSTVGPSVCVQQDTTTTSGSGEGPVIHPKDVYVMGSDVLPGFDEGDILRYDSEHRVWFADHAIPLEGVVLAAMRPYCKQAREADPTDPNWVTRLVSPSEAAAMENEGYNNFYNVSNANDVEESEETHATYPTPPPTTWQAERMAADPSLRLVHEHVGHFYVYRFCMDGTTYYHGTVPNFSNPKKRRTNNNNANNAITSGGSNNNNIKSNTYNSNANSNNNTAAASRLPASHKGTHEVPCTGQDEVTASERGSHGGASEAPVSKATPSQASFSHTTQQQQQTPSLQGQTGMLYKATSNDNNNITAAAVTVGTEESNSAAAMPRGTIVVAAAEAASTARKASNNTNTYTNNNTSKATGSAVYLPTAAIGRSIASALFFSSSCHDDDASNTTGAVAASSPTAQVDYTSNATGLAIRHNNNNYHHHRDGIRGNVVEADRHGMASLHAASLGVQQQQQASGTTTTNSNSNGAPVLSQHTAATLKAADNTNEEGTSGAAMREVRRVASRDYGTAAQAPTRRRTTSNTTHVPLTNNTTTTSSTTTPAPLFTPPSYLTSRVTSTAVDTARKWVRHLYSYAYGAQSRSRERGPSATPSASTSTTIMASSPSVRVGTTTTTTTPPVMTGAESVQAEQRGGTASHTMRISVGRVEPNMASVQPTAVLQTQQQQQQVAMYAPHNVSNPHASSANGYGTAMPYAGSPVLQPPFRRNEATNNTNTSNSVAGYGHYPSTVSPAAAMMMGPAVVTGVQPGMQWSANGSAASPSAGPLPTSHNTYYYQHSVTNTTHAAPVYNDIQTQDTTATAAAQAVSTTPMTTTGVPVAVEGGHHIMTHVLPAGQAASPSAQQLPQVSNTSEGVQGDVGSHSERAIHDGTAAAINYSPSPPQPVLRRVRRRYKVYPQPMAEVQASPTTTTTNQQSQLVVDDEHGATGGLQPGAIVHSPVSTKRFVASGSYVWDWRPQ